MAKKSVQRGKSGEVSLLEDHFRVLVDHTSDIIFLRDAKGKILYITPSIKSLGYKPEELIGKAPWGLVYKDDQGLVEGWKEKILKKEKSFQTQARVKTKTGDYVWLDTVTKVISGENGEFKYFLSTSRNITKQKQAEADGERLKTIIEESLNELYLINPKTLKFTYGNTKALENLGYSLAEFIKLGPQNVAAKRPKKFFNELFIPLLEGKKKKIFFQGQNRRKDGSIYNVEATLQVTESGGKKLIAVLIEDISEKLKVQAEARAINERYRILTENTNDIILLRDPNGKVLYVSPAIKKHLGYTEEEILGKTFWKYLDEKGKKRIPEWKQQVFSEGRSIRIQARAKTQKGNFIWLESETRPVKDDTGKVIFCVSSFRNIEAEKKAELEIARLAAIVEGAVNEIYVSDLKTLKFIYANNQARKNLGYSQKELSNMTPADIGGHLSKREFAKIYGRMLKGGGISERVEGRAVRKDGTTYEVSLVGQLITLGEKPVFVTFMEDITERKQAENLLHQAQKMEVVGQLTGGIAHNFNNLLTTILASLRLLEQKEEKPEKLEMLELAIKSTKRGAELTHRLLSFARKQHLAPTILNIEEILDEVDSLLVFAMGGNIEIITEKLKGEIFVKVDPGEFESALLNLALNARDAMPKGGTIRISAENQILNKEAAMALELEPGSYVVTKLTDNGEGMSGEVLEKVFEPFFTTKDIGEGSGLGLSMVFGFAKQSGGAMDIESELGKGTSVRIYLPKEN